MDMVREKKEKELKNGEKRIRKYSLKESKKNISYSEK